MRSSVTISVYENEIISNNICVLIETGKGVEVLYMLLMIGDVSTDHGSSDVISRLVCDPHPDIRRLKHHLLSVAPVTLEHSHR